MTSKNMVAAVALSAASIAGCVHMNPTADGIRTYQQGESHRISLHFSSGYQRQALPNSCKGACHAYEIYNQNIWAVTAPGPCELPDDVLAGYRMKPKQYVIESNPQSNSTWVRKCR